MEREKFYKKFEQDRERYAAAILESDARKKIIIAGPGTGKSYLFREICEKNADNGNVNNLTLSFINELVDDLKTKLHQVSDVKTLHGFALSNFKEHDKYFLDLENVLNKDYEIIFGKKLDFKKILCNLINAEKAIEFYFKRLDYYGHYSPNSSIHALVKFFQEDKTRIPEYSQVLVDEYQDFNKLECTLIDLIGEKNPILVVGDDDQSLYGWKHANLEDIRLKSESPDYEKFDLPYCSRCTRVIINAFNHIVDEAKKRGFLKKRSNKEFKYFPSEEKDLVSDKHKTISVKTEVYPGSETFHVDKEIKKNLSPKDNRPSPVLVICPFRKHVRSIEKQLRRKGYRNITTRLSSSNDGLMGGFRLLLKDSKCNLGWRIVSESILGEDKFRHALVASHKNSEQKYFCNLLNLEDRKYIKSLLTNLRKIKKGESVEEEILSRIFSHLGYHPVKMAMHKLRQSMETSSVKKNTHKDVPIKVTTIEGSKGLDGNLVFLINFDKKFILEDGTKISDEIVRKFLVALTRTRDKLYIFSFDKSPPFIDWLGKGMYELS